MSAMVEENEAKEISREEGIATLLQDERFQDIALQGNDGHPPVGCSRNILASRSRVFRGMLLGDFQEKKQPVIEIDYPGAVVQAIVQYIYSDTADIFVKHFNIGSRMPRAFPAQDEDDISMLITLSGAAAYYELYELQKKSVKLIEDFIMANRFYSFWVLEACKLKGPAAPKQLLKSAMSKIRSSTIPCGKYAKFVVTLSPSTLEDLLKDNKMEWTEFQLFELLMHWQKDGLDDERKPHAKRLLQFIHLERIAPSKLATDVADSGLISQERLLHIYKRQALAMEANYNATEFTEPRCRLFVWSKTGTDTLEAEEESGFAYSDVLKNCPPIKSGVHEWAVEIESESDSLYQSVGIIDSGAQAFTEDDDLCYMDDAWCICEDGNKYVQGEEDVALDFFGEGTRLKMKLDLRDTSIGNGTLQVVIDSENDESGDGESIMIANNLLSYLEVNPAGFLPAVTVGYGGRVVFCGFDESGDEDL